MHSPIDGHFIQQVEWGSAEGEFNSTDGMAIDSKGSTEYMLQRGTTVVYKLSTKYIFCLLVSVAVYLHT